MPVNAVAVGDCSGSVDIASAVTLTPDDFAACISAVRSTPSQALILFCLRIVVPFCQLVHPGILIIAIALDTKAIFSRCVCCSTVIAVDTTHDIIIIAVLDANLFPVVAVLESCAVFRSCRRSDQEISAC